MINLSIDKSAIASLKLHTLEEWMLLFSRLEIYRVKYSSIGFLEAISIPKLAWAAPFIAFYESLTKYRKNHIIERLSVVVLDLAIRNCKTTNNLPNLDIDKIFAMLRCSLVIIGEYDRCFASRKNAVCKYGEIGYSLIGNEYLILDPNSMKQISRKRTDLLAYKFLEKICPSNESFIQALKFYRYFIDLIDCLVLQHYEYENNIISKNFDFEALKYIVINQSKYKASCKEQNIRSCDIGTVKLLKQFPVIHTEGELYFIPIFSLLFAFRTQNIYHVLSHYLKEKNIIGDFSGIYGKAFEEYIIKVAEHIFNDKTIVCSSLPEANKVELCECVVQLDEFIVAIEAKTMRFKFGYEEDYNLQKIEETIHKQFHKAVRQISETFKSIKTEKKQIGLIVFHDSFQYPEALWELAGIATNDCIFFTSISLNHFETLLSYPQYAIEKGFIDFFKNKKSIKNIMEKGVIDCVKKYAEETNIFDSFRPWVLPV